MENFDSPEKEYGGDPLAVVTGASSGIGYEIAKVFAKKGFSLLIAAQSEKIWDVLTELRGLGATAEAVQADLATADGIDRLYQAIQTQKRPVEAVALNAGVGVSGEFAETSLDEELNLVSLNIVANLRLAKKLLPDMIARRTGKILFTSSIAAEMPGPYYAVYAASKAFIQSFAEALRLEVKDKGIAVTALQPGATDTNFFARAGMEDTPAGREKKDDPATVAEDGVNALLAGKDHVVAGSFMNKVQAGMAKILPESVGAKMQGKSTKPDSVNTH